MSDSHRWVPIWIQDTDPTKCIQSDLVDDRDLEEALKQLLPELCDKLVMDKFTTQFIELSRNKKLRRSDG